MPANAAADRQTRQSTSDRSAEEPTVAAAVWATVLSARIAAARTHADVKMRLPILFFMPESFPFL